MKTVELTIQGGKDFCVCSVLQAIFRRNGVEVSQKEIASNLTRGKERGYLVHDKKIIDFMAGKGFIYQPFGVHETPFNEPDELLKEMNQYDGIVAIGNHAYLLKDFQHDTLTLVDPKDGEEVEKNYLELVREIGDDGFFGLVKKIS